MYAVNQTALQQLPLTGLLFCGEGKTIAWKHTLYLRQLPSLTIDNLTRWRGLCPLTSFCYPNKLLFPNTLDPLKKNVIFIAKLSCRQETLSFLWNPKIALGSKIVAQSLCIFIASIREQRTHSKAKF